MPGRFVSLAGNGAAFRLPGGEKISERNGESGEER